MADLDRELVTRAVRRALDATAATVPEWRTVPLPIGLGVGTESLVRLSGEAGLADGRAAPWSIVAKTVVAPTDPTHEGLLPSHWAYWRRESLLYRSGLLDDLGGGLVAPRCYAVHETPRRVTFLLEDLVDAPRPWDAARYALAAEHLGRFNGTFAAARALPEREWLARDMLEDRVRATRVDARELLAAVARVPRTFRHGDPFRNNLFAVVRDGESRTAAIDWSMAGIGPLGADAANLAVGGFISREGALDPRALARAIVEGYVRGLVAAGAGEHERPARLGFAASVVITALTLRAWIERYLGDAGDRAALEAATRRSAADIRGDWADLASFADDCAMDVRRPG